MVILVIYSRLSDRYATSVSPCQKLSRRAVKEGQKCLIVDDFLKGGGTAKGMVDLMREFGVTVVGMTFVMSTAQPMKKRISGEKSLMVMDIDPDAESAFVKPAFWLNGDV